MKHFCGDRKARKAMKKALKEKRILPWSAYRRAKRTYQAEYDALVAAQMSPEDAKERAAAKAVGEIQARPSWSHGPLFTVLFCLALFLFFSGEGIYQATGGWANWYVVYEFFTMIVVGFYFLLTRNHRRKVDWILYAIMATAVTIGFAQGVTRLIVVSSPIKQFRVAYYYPGLFVTHLDWYAYESPYEYLGSSWWTYYFFPEILTAFGCSIYSIVKYIQSRKGVTIVTKNVAEKA